MTTRLDSNQTKPFAGRALLLATPVKGGVSPSYTRSARMLERWCIEQEIEFDERYVLEAPIDAARNVLAAAYLAAVSPLGRPFTWCLMADAGVGFDTDTVEKLLLADEDFTAAAVPLRQTRIDKAIEEGDPRMSAAFAVMLTPEMRETGRAKIITRGGAPFMAIDGIGAALICVKQKVFTRLFDAYPELRHRSGFSYFQPTCLDDSGASHATRLREAIEKALRADDSQLARDSILRAALDMDHEEFEARGEDIAFCMRWRRLDTEEKPAKIWLLCDAPIVHEGHGVWTGNFSDQFSPPK